MHDSSEQSPLPLLQKFNHVEPHRASLLKSDADEYLTAKFEAGGYPRIAFPCPNEGFDLSAYRGIKIEAINRSEHAVRGALRVDNPGKESDQFWNTETVLLQPGQPIEIRLVFGQNNGKPGFPLDPSTISDYQFFLINPKEEATTIQLSSPKAYGAPSEEQQVVRYSKPSDRNTNVTPPSWLGSRPPVKGDWKLTLNEEFDGGTVNPDIWSTRLAYGGPAREDAQRYRDQNVVLKDGKAHLKLEHSLGHQYDDPSLPERDYAAGMLSSYDRWTQRYGYFEMRAKAPTAKGLGIVFGLIPDRGAEGDLNMHERRTSHDFNGKGMEMDIFRHKTEWGIGRVAYSTRWGGPAGTHIQKHWGDSYVYFGKTKNDWHTYGMLWEADHLVWYIDGVQKGEWRSEAIADVQCYLSITMPIANYDANRVANEALPDSWDIDYIRVWQHED